MTRARPWLSDSRGAAGRAVAAVAAAAAASVPSGGGCCVLCARNSWLASRSAVCVCCTDGNSGPTCAGRDLWRPYGGPAVPPRLPPPRLGPCSGRLVPRPRSYRARERFGTCSGAFTSCSSSVEAPLAGCAPLQVPIRPPVANKVQLDESNPDQAGSAGQGHGAGCGCGAWPRPRVASRQSGLAELFGRRVMSGGASKAGRDSHHSAAGSCRYVGCCIPDVCTVCRCYWVSPWRDDKQGKSRPPNVKICRH